MAQMSRPASRNRRSLMVRQTDDDAGSASSINEAQPLLNNSNVCSENKSLYRRFVSCLSKAACIRPSLYQKRVIGLNGICTPHKFVSNEICNQKYSILSFVPKVLYEQFRYFFNLFYLLVAASQFFPVLQIGYRFTSVAPLVFVLTVTLLKEAFDDIARMRRDRVLNNEMYDTITRNGVKRKKAQDLKVGDIIKIEKNQRVPADILFLQSDDENGNAFIRTDQLDGETDLKLKRAVTTTQSIPYHRLWELHSTIHIEAPKKDLYVFEGKIDIGQASHSSHRSASPYQSSPPSNPSSSREQRLKKSLSPDNDITPSPDVLTINHQNMVESLNIDQTIWSSSVISNVPYVIGVVIYTGIETKCLMNQCPSRYKVGKFDRELNTQSKILCAILFVASVFLTLNKGLSSIWYIYLVRFILLLSSIIPISLRVTMDMAKTTHGFLVAKDTDIPNTMVRTSTIPEELGSVNFLLSDKTGTLTRNDMVFKRLHLGTQCYSMVDAGSSHEMGGELLKSFECLYGDGVEKHLDSGGEDGGLLAEEGKRGARRIGNSAGLAFVGGASTQLRQSVLALALCHSVTPVGSRHERKDRGDRAEGIAVDIESGCEETEYQASSPDEIALVKFASSIGLKLRERSDSLITLETPNGFITQWEILFCFPFSSETKRMGIIVKEKRTPHQKHSVWHGPSSNSGFVNEQQECYLLLVKGAESVMMERLRTKGTEWLSEECDAFARSGLRTLVIAYRELNANEVNDFAIRYKEARNSMKDRNLRVLRCIESIESPLRLLALTGVEDRLQTDVTLTIEKLRHAGIKIWLLTGDKVETAICIAISAGLRAMNQLCVISSDQYTTEPRRMEALEAFSLAAENTVLVLDSVSLATFLLPLHVEYFISVASKCPSVVCCRCSPTQKAEVVNAIKKITNKITCAIGDGGNDVAMIKAADIGIGIEGKEGKQASLAADYSITQFSYIQKLLLWHGRNSFIRSAKLAQFIFHRGLIISVIQVIFSSVFFFIPLAVFQGMLQVGYTTVFTTFPMFALILDEELPSKTVLQYPELYESLNQGRHMGVKIFLGWVLQSMYQGGVIILASLLLFDDSLHNIVAICFTALVASELLNVITEIHRWHKYMVIAELFSVFVYLLAIVFLPTYFDIHFVFSQNFLYRVSLAIAASWLPPHIFKVIRRIIKPPQYAKLVELN